MVKSIEFPTLRLRNSYIINQRQKHVPISQLADELDLSLRQVKRVFANYVNYRQVGRKKGSGRPRKLDAPTKLRIYRMITANPRLTCRQIADRLNGMVSAETVRQYLKSQDFVNKKASRIPNLSEADKERRVTFAQASMEQEFDTTFFTDECTFTLNGTAMVWARKGQRVNQPMHTYPPKVQVWGAISSEGKAYLEVVEGIVDATKYSEMLEQRFIPLGNEIMGEGEWTLQHDGARCHTARLVNDMLEENDIETMDWPARSPDLNPIENVWGILKRQVYRKNPQTQMELEDVILEEWENLDDNMVAEIAQSFKTRLREVIRTNGEAIRY